MLTEIKERLNKFIAYYSRCYLLLAVLYLFNKSILISKFDINIEVYIQLALLILMLLSKFIIVNIILQARKYRQEFFWLLILVAILLPFGEAYSAVKLRNKIDLAK